MVNEVMPDYIADQTVYYSAAPNFYGYYCTGLESPGESDGHHRFFGVDGKDLHYSGTQMELPCVYYTPSYEYVQSPYNHYSTCSPSIPGPAIGVDGQFVGPQHYFTNGASPAFFPAVQSGANFIVNALESLVLNPVAPGAGGVDAVSMKLTPSAPASIASSMQQPDYAILGPELSQIPSNQLHPSSKVPRGFQVAATNTKSHASDGAMACNSVPFITHARDSTGIIQASDRLKVENVHSILSTLKVNAPPYKGSSKLGPNTLARVTTDRGWPRLQPSGVVNNANGRASMLVEQNRGPRMDRSKGSWQTLAVKSFTTKVGAHNAQGNITICPDQYNGEDFPVNYSDAKLFIIKSYSEDDVHKSIKYSVWSSTSSGNKRLDSAYEEAKRISGGDMRKCPIFLFFSVNGSGHFCGVAEMIGPVDFNRDMDFWLQDKWTGSFPVKWHIIKDVPNSNFRHIILENNENKPVTNSRDTQEVKFMPGMSMLNIFKNISLRTSLLDDFMYYEERQMIMFEEKSRLPGRGYGNTLLLPAFPTNKSKVTIKHPLKMEEKPVKVEVSMKGSDVSVEDKNTTKLQCAGEAKERKPAVSEVSQEAGDLESTVVKIGYLSTDSREGEAKQSATSTVTMEPADQYVTVGSVSIKVDGYGESSSKIPTAGTILIDPEASKQKCPNGALRERKGVVSKDS